MSRGRFKWIAIGLGIAFVLLVEVASMLFVEGTGSEYSHMVAAPITAVGAGAEPEREGAPTPP